MRSLDATKFNIMIKKTRKPKPGQIVIGKDQKTRSRLIEAGGIIFSEKGYDRATAREICEMAQANSAAINYYFGGKDRFYLEVLREAHLRLTVGLRDAGESLGSPEERLKHLIGGFISSILGPPSELWTIRVIVKEVMAPTWALEELVDVQIRPSSVLLRALIADLMELPVDHPSVVRGSLCTIGQLVFHLQNKNVIQLMFPDLYERPESVAELTHFVYEYSVAGLQKLMREAKAGKGE